MTLPCTHMVVLGVEIPFHSYRVPCFRRPRPTRHPLCRENLAPNRFSSRSSCSKSYIYLSNLFSNILASHSGMWKRLPGDGTTPVDGKRLCSRGRGGKQEGARQEDGASTEGENQGGRECGLRRR